jgi:hypothetical protein
MPSSSGHASAKDQTNTRPALYNKGRSGDAVGLDNAPDVPQVTVPPGTYLQHGTHRNGCRAMRQEPVLMRLLGSNLRGCWSLSGRASVGCALTILRTRGGSCRESHRSKL